MELEAKKKVLSDLGLFFKEVVAEYKGELGATKSSQIGELKTRMACAINTAKNENGWFTAESVVTALNAWSTSLEEKKVGEWLSNYDLDNVSTQTAGVIMAGNLPLVGLHDALCVLVSGHHLAAKLSSKDTLLMTIVLDAISCLAKEWGDCIQIVGNLKNIDILIATGSDNSARYFEYYFREKKRLIRKNRTSIAVLDGNETEAELEGLSHDIFSHFGLGCRNVTKLYLPNGYDLDKVFNALFQYKEVVNHNKYANNYDYNKAVYLLNQVELVENGFLLLKEDEGLHSPVGVLFYEFYKSLQEIESILNQHKDSIQCVVSNQKLSGHVPFGKSQSPQLWDYADGVDTIIFLLS